MNRSFSGCKTSLFVFANGMVAVDPVCTPVTVGEEADEMFKVTLCYLWMGT